MKLVKLCYKIKRFFRKREIAASTDEFFENLIVWYYRCFKNQEQGISIKNRRNRKVIISLTSIPSRIDKLWITIESLLRQTYKPDKIILWLAEEEFRDVELPDKLKKQQNRGLEICYCENLRSYKKYYYTAKRYPNDYIVTVDDDIIYAEDMLEALVTTYKDNQGCIVCHRSHVLKKGHRALCGYNHWLKFEERKQIESQPSFSCFFTGSGGTLFPMFRMNRQVFDKDAFMKLAPCADDVWLNFCAWISDMKIVNTKGIWGHIIEIQSSSNNGLSIANVVYRKNDEQIKQVLEYLKIDVNQYL